MAIYPCALGQHRYAGPQQSIYLTVLQGATADSRKLRLCPAHFMNMRSEVQHWMIDIRDEPTASMVCGKCGKDKESTVFARVFANHTEEEAYAQDLCAACREAWEGAVSIFDGEPL